jgi:ribosomal protein L40E
MNVLVLALWFAAVWLAAMGAWIVALTDVAGRPVPVFWTVGRTKGVTVALVVLTGWIGAAYYFAVIRPSLVAAERNLPRATTAGDAQYCVECDMRPYPADATRCTNCGSERLAPLASRKPK